MGMKIAVETGLAQMDVPVDGMETSHIHRDDRVHLEDKEAKSFLVGQSGRYRRTEKIFEGDLNEECREGCTFEELREHGKGYQEVLVFMKEYNCKHKGLLPCPYGQACVATNGDTFSISNLHVDCSDIVCTKQLALENGEVSVSKFTIDGTAKYSCKKGYALKGASTARCEISGEKGKWSADRPQCQEITCDQPSLLFNGTVSAPAPSTFGSAVSYKCDKGFVLEGKENSTCVENGFGNVKGKWEDSTPVCRAITCDTPSLTNGQVSVPKTAHLGSAVSYQCDTGYVLEGKGNSTCVEDGPDNVKGSWADPTPACTAITCDTPSLTNGRVSGPKPALLGSAVSYLCDTGYVLEGKGNSSCIQNGSHDVKGKWADLTPVCIAITCEPPVISNGHVSVTKPAVYGSTATYRCNNGFVLDGKGSSQCNRNGTENVYGKWTNQSPVCKAISCDTPLLLNGQVRAGGQRTNGTTVIFRCDKGFILEGKTNSTCVHEDPNIAKGKWSEPTPVCKAITCEPPVISNGHASVTKAAVYGSNVTYRCNQGFVLDGKESSKCIQNRTDSVYGKWNDQSPVCKAISCDTPFLLNGEVTSVGLSTHGTTVSYRCDVGFILDGKTNSTCVHEDPNSAKGNWSEQTPVCKTITCEPPVISNGHASVTKAAVYGSNVTYRCNQGFVLDGKESSKCIQNRTDSVYGKWNDQSPVCKAISCDTPFLLNGEVTSVGLSTHGTTVSYRCDVGFILDGKTNSTCVHEDPNSAKGKWSEQTPVCKTISCDTPLLLNGQVIAGGQSTHGTTLLPVNLLSYQTDMHQSPKQPCMGQM
ncbi:sushi, von Willebrand factor type A, EGF and pentraxin domain-containing protein 1-like [Lineus longissimus]|uniref:sushi, von Willebrand factor type A, EGF and pentraxin domain-containing protein 1-like n=1 Tax=Lineus longissimus TaxID=88925 RepID=UPI00315DF872